MLGDTVREARIRKGLTQARLARMAGVSRRHLAALEKGANVSVLVLRKVASVLDLVEINLGGLMLRAADEKPPVNLHLLADAIRDARVNNTRVESMLSRADGILGGEAASPPSTAPDGTSIVAQFPRMPARSVALPAQLAQVHENGADWMEVRTAGVFSQGRPVDESVTESVIVPASLIEKGEILFRVRGDDLRDEGIGDGDLLIVQLRPKGRAATGELAIGRLGKATYIGRWWQKNGRKALVSAGLGEVAVGRSTRGLKVVAVVNQVIRPI
ncbi:MAG TPA: helix-turn-helix domain-containing protein [Thermoanaerobaculia bacterium]|nr:helix-turn-helix domain-containing protein [Thermoanaerobaculia bacterium]